MKVTVDDVMKHRSCYSREKVENLWAGRESLTHVEIMALDIPAEDRLWGLITLCMAARSQRLFACDCAERALSRVGNPDTRSVDAIRVSREYAVGEATEEQLAALDAALDAVLDAARDAMGAALAASDAASDAARAAAWAAAWAARKAEREWQLKKALEYCD